jgi:uncharacterized protein
MEKLRNRYLRLLDQVNMEFVRYLYDEINWSDQLIVIKGQRGVGKTTLILQYIRNEIKDPLRALYVSLDDMHFTNHSLMDLAETFVLNGGKHLFIDEVHRYPQWSMILKNLYDFYPDLQIIVSGSSAIALELSKADLGRRASVYTLYPLSFREFVALHHHKTLPSISLMEVLEHHETIAVELNKKIKSIELFNQYLRFGTYPFWKEKDALYYDKLRLQTGTVIDTDIPATEKITYETQIKIKKLLQLISAAVPFKPNISELSQKVGTSRDLLLRYLHLLANAGILHLINQQGSTGSILQKPEKIYLDNSVLMLAFDDNAKEGTIRETFFVNQISVRSKIVIPPKGDFLVNDRYLFEVGGKNKTQKQIATAENSFLALAEIPYGYQNRIPLWLFGLTY